MTPEYLNKKRIVLNRDTFVANYVITLSSIITEATSARKVEFEHNKLFIIDNKDKFEFNEKYHELMDKIIFQFLPDTSNQLLHLTEKESDLFRKCSHAAYYFAKEKTGSNSPLEKSFIKIHEKYFII